MMRIVLMSQNPLHDQIFYGPAAGNAGRTSPQVGTSEQRRAAASNDRSAPSGDRRGRYRRRTLKQKRRNRGSQKVENTESATRPCEPPSRIGKEAATTTTANDETRRKPR